MIRFFITLFGVCVLIIGGIHAAHHQSWLLYLPSFLYETTIFLVFTTGVMYTYLHKVQKPDSFVQLYLLMMVVKFFLYGGYVYFMIIKDSIGAPMNVSFFMILYFIFTGLEVAFLYLKISPKTQPPNT